MTQAIAAMLTPALGVAISPFPIMGLILLLLGERGRIDSVFFTLGWMLGNALIYTVALLAMDSIVTAAAAFSAQMQAASHLLVAALLLGLAFHSLHKIPKKGQVAAPPKWLDKMEHMGPFESLGIGFALSAFNPLDMALSLNAGINVGELSLSFSQYGWSILVFVLLASCTVIVPTAVFLIAGSRMGKTLHQWYGWLVQHGQLVLAVLFFLLAVENIAKAL